MSWRMRRERVGRARPGPVRAAVVREVEALLRAGDDVVAVVRVDAHLADRVVLRELARRARRRPAPKTLAPSTVQFAPPSVDLRMPWLPIENEP